MAIMNGEGTSFLCSQIATDKCYLFCLEEANSEIVYNQLAYWLRHGIHFPPHWQRPLHSWCFPGALCCSHCWLPAAAAGPACPYRPAAWSGLHLASQHRSETVTRWAARQIRYRPKETICKFIHSHYHSNSLECIHQQTNLGQTIKLTVHLSLPVYCNFTLIST